MDIVLDLDDSTWFSSDQHFGHKSIISYDRRPFRDLEEMHASLIKQHNDSRSGQVRVCTPAGK